MQKGARASHAVALDDAVGGHTTMKHGLPQIALDEPGKRQRGARLRSAASVMMSTRKAPRFRILVVEDYDDSRELLVALLRAWDYHAVGAADAREALVIAEEMPFDLVLTDFAMPRMTGAELATAFARDPRLARTPIVYVTGMTPPRPANVIATFAKPIPVDNLARFLESLRSQRRLRVAK